MRLCYWFSKGLIALILKLIFRIRLKIKGSKFLPKIGPFLLISNHLSFLDPSIVGLSCPRRLVFLARQDLFDNRLLGAWMKSVGCISIRRDSTDFKAIRDCLKALKEGEVLAVFPEGSRQLSLQNSFQNLKKGFLLLAKKSGAPVVAAKIYGTDVVLPKGAKGIKRGTEVMVSFSKPFLIDKNEDYEHLLEHLNFEFRKL